MKPGMPCHILHGQCLPGLKAGDSLVLRPVILEHPLNILHAGNSKNICHKNKQPQKTFHQIQEHRVLRNHMKQLCRPRRNGDKQHCRQGKGENHGACQLLVRQLLILLPCHLGRVAQGTDAHHQ